MSKKKRLDYRVVVYPDVGSGLDYNLAEAPEICNDLIQIFERIRGVSYACILKEEIDVCEYCGEKWKTDSDGMPICCRNARADCILRKDEIDVLELSCVIGEGWKVECKNGKVYDVFDNPILGIGQPRWIAVRSLEENKPLILELEESGNSDFTIVKAIDIENQEWEIRNLKAYKTKDGETNNE